MESTGSCQVYKKQLCGKETRQVKSKEATQVKQEKFPQFLATATMTQEEVKFSQEDTLKESSC